VGIPLAFLIDGHVDALVGCLSFFLLLPTTVTLCLLFVPKIIMLKSNARERLQINSLTVTRDTSVNIAEKNNASLESTQSVNDPSMVTRLQEEIATLKDEIRAIKLQHGENAKPNLSVRIAHPVENGREGKSFTQPAPKPSSRPQLGKRSVTCHTYQEMCVRKPRRRRRSSSFSGPYLQRRSLDLGALFSELADPLLVLKAENKDLHRKLQEVRISEAGKLAKVLHENAQLNKKIVELNIQNASSDGADKVSRLLKENSELKKQLGEVSILNSACCDVTPRLQRKQNEDRKISKDLRELTQLLSVDLGARRPGSFGPSSINRPPPVGRSQSSSELQLNRNGSGSAEKKRNISPLTKEAKRFSFDSVGNKQNFCTKDSGVEIALLVSDASPLTPWRKSNESEPAISPGTIRRDNIDGCESEKDSSDTGERTNAGFSGDEDEDTCIFKSGNQMEDLKFALNYSANNVETAKNSQIGDPTNKVMFSTNISASPDAKEELKSNENDATMDPNGDLALNVKSVNGPLGTTTQGASKQLGAAVDQHMTDPTTSDHNGTLEIDTPVTCRDTFSVAKQDDTATVLKSDSLLETTTKNFEIPLRILAFNSVHDDNDNFPSSEGEEESNFSEGKSEINHSLEETGAVASQDEEKMNSLDWTLDSVVHDTSNEAKAVVLNEESANDVPAFKKKLQRKKDKKNDRIEKTFFV